MNELTKEQLFFIDVINNTNSYLAINYNKEYKKYLPRFKEQETNQFDIIILQKYLEHHPSLTVDSKKSSLSIEKLSFFIILCLRSISYYCIILIDSEEAL